MKYTLSTEQFKQGKMFDSNGKFSHKTGCRFKLFPFLANTSSEPILELRELIGAILCKIEDKDSSQLSVEQLIESLKKETEIEHDQEVLFEATIRKVFFDKNGEMRPLSLKMIEQIPCDDNIQHKVVDYLVDVLGDKTILKTTLQGALRKEIDTSNVIVKFVLTQLETGEVITEAEDTFPYFRITDSLKEVFEEDFKYILDNQKRSREYLVDLFEFYYFSYTAQAILQLKRFLGGKRSETTPLYFCLEWENTSQSRKCFTEGWQMLLDSIETIFAHAVTLEIINHTEPESEPVDYISLQSIILNRDDKDSEIAEKIIQLARIYRDSITDSEEMKAVELEDYGQSKTDNAIHFLFDSIRTQFENTGRKRAYDEYASKFKRYCNKFLKVRGRSGRMLNISEETLIFLTKLCIKDKEKVRLNAVFEALELRGVYLDSSSKDQVAIYYEKLNLIEKKSDSGDAKYVKRIL